MSGKRHRNRPDPIPVGNLHEDEGRLYVLTGQGQTFDARQRKLPPKMGRQHRLIVNVSYTITWEGAHIAASGKEQFHLDQENQVMFSVGCWDCEQPYELIKDNPICPAPASPD